MKIKYIFSQIVLIMAVSTPVMAYEVSRNAPQKNLTVYRIDMNQNENVSIEQENFMLVVRQVVDSRCPANVVCFWEGMVQARVAIMQNNSEIAEVEAINHLGKPSVEPRFLGRYKLSLTFVAQRGNLNGAYQLSFNLERSDDGEVDSEWDGNTSEVSASSNQDGNMSTRECLWIMKALVNPDTGEKVLATDSCMIHEYENRGFVGDEGFFKAEN
ncbi:MAG: hypothetical protein HQK54_12805 [Oligoflexales bacterium]|nr:hypothetical protein [Oligoflexales bacterium]